MNARQVDNPKTDNPHLRSWVERFGYRVLRRMTQMWFLLFYKVRAFGRENFPAEGAALICSNHQSHYDPLLVGHICRRRMNYVARKTLFKFKPFAIIINFLDAIPLDKSGMGIAGIKETIKRLKRGEFVLIFPEGTRCFDGEIADFHEGFVVIARRTKTTIVPVGFDGAFHAWPRSRPYPLPGKIALSVGEPITYEQYKDLTDKEVANLLRERITIEFERARRSVGYKVAPQAIDDARNGNDDPPQD